MIVELPISKSIANRLLVRTFVRGGDLTSFPLDNACADVSLLHSILLADAEQIKRHGGLTGIREVANCGTAMRFLTALYACMRDTDVVLTGSERMQQRPIGGLVTALRQLGADIAYVKKDNYPPLHIRGKVLQGGSVTMKQPESTQFVSALLLVSDLTREGIAVETDCSSPYIGMTEQIVSDAGNIRLERDWSAAAFWYEYVALHAEQEILLWGLDLHTLQGDCRVVDIFRRMGVVTEERPEGVLIRRLSGAVMPDNLSCNFSDCPDLYPAVYMACRKLGITMSFTGLERLPLKECDRLQAFGQLESADSTRVCHTYADHRIAMALVVAGYEVDDMACIAKSYPAFSSQWTQCKNIC